MADLTARFTEIMEECEGISDWAIDKLAPLLATTAEQHYQRHVFAVDALASLLGDASEGTVDPERAMEIARHAIAEACDNREGK